MNRNLLIIGAGGHGRVVADAAYRSSSWQEIAFVDDKSPILESSGNFPVIGTLTDLKELQKEWPYAIVAIGNNRLRLDLQKLLESMDYRIAVVIHPSAQVARDVRVADGSVLFANSVVNSGATLGHAVILNTSATIDHDCKIGNGVHISPGVHLGGSVVVGELSWLGIGASVVNNCTLGVDVTVGAGACVINDVPDALTVVGIPARPSHDKPGK